MARAMRRDLPLLAELEDHVGQRRLLDRGQPLGRRRSLRLVHPHVERLVAPEAEAAAVGVELQRRDAEVGQHAGHRADAVPVEHRVEVAVVGVRRAARRSP